MSEEKKFWSSTELADAAGLSRQHVVYLLNKGRRAGGIEGHKAGGGAGGAGMRWVRRGGV